MNMKLLFKLKSLFLAFLLATPICHATELKRSSIKTIKDLRIESRLAKDKKLPLLILFSAEDCEFCEVIREDYLEPMLASGEYANKVIIREVMATNYDYVRDFNGELIGADNLALRYQADLSPTVVIINSDGQVLAEPLVGITSRHYYDEQLDETINNSLRMLAKLEKAEYLE